MSSTEELEPQEDQSTYSLRADLTWSIVTCLLDCMLALKVSSVASARHVLLCWVIPLQNLAVAWCIVRQPGAYRRHRTGILAVPKLLRMVTLGVAFRGYADVPASPPASPADGQLGTVAFLVDKGALNLLMSALDRRLPLRTHLVVQLTALVLVLYSNTTQCRRDCADPSSSQLYTGLEAHVNALMHKVLPINFASRRDLPSSRPCLLFVSWFQVVLGFVVPTLYIDWVEERGRWDAQERRARTAPSVYFLPQPIRAALVQVTLLAVALPVVWRAVAFVDWLAPRVG